MARAVQQIYDSIVADYSNYEALNGMNSVSNTALFKLFAYVFAYAAWTIESLFDLFKADVDKKLLTPAHNARWYQQMALKYQHGDELVWSDTQEAFVYLEIDEEKQMIARAAAIEQAGRLLIKVVKEVAGDLQPLSPEEMAGFETYMNKIREFVRIATRSWLPDDLAVEYDIHYDPLLLAADGSLLSDSSIFPVQVASDNYVKTLDFNGRFSIAKLEDAIQAAKGVVDFRRNLIASRHGADSFSVIDVDRIAESGYMILHSNSEIHYIARNV